MFKRYIIAGLLIIGIAILGFTLTQTPRLEQVAMDIEVRYPENVLTGQVVIELFSDEAPITVKNFLDYVNSGFYDQTMMHRVIPNFVIQGGGFDTDFNKKAIRAPIENEAKNGKKNLAWTLSMARTNDIHSASSQFFINLRDNRSLDHRNDSARGYGYAVFGRVLSGQNILNKVLSVPTQTVGQYQNVPKYQIVITKASILR